MGLGFRVSGFGCKAKQTTHMLMVLPSAALHVYPVFGPEADTLKEFPQPIIEDLGFRAWGSSFHHQTPLKVPPLLKLFVSTSFAVMVQVQLELLELFSVLAGPACQQC